MIGVTVAQWVVGKRNELGVNPHRDDFDRRGHIGQKNDIKRKGTRVRRREKVVHE